MYLPCKLTEEELTNCRDMLADAVRQKARAEENLKSAATQLKSEIAVSDGKINRYAEMINSKTEYRYVECSIEFDFKSREKKLARTDTGEIVKVVRITDGEMQEELA
jgi:hypothetical protein